MKKTISISLGGYIFNIEEDAYERLRLYLDAIKSHFSSLPDAGEITSDMEARMAEQFRAAAGTTGIVTIEHVDSLIKTMGKPEDFGDAAASHEQSRTEPQPQRKKLMRNPDDKIVAGVASGFAAYFGIDAIIIRIIFALLMLLGGYGVLFYIVLWLVIPEANTPTEKMQMKGEPVTLKAVEQTVKEKIQEAKGPTKAFATGAGKGLSTIVRRLIVIFAKLVGFGIILAAAFGLIALVFSLVALLLNQNSPYVDFPLKDLITGLPYYLSIFTAFFAVLIPLIFLLMAGSSLLRGKVTANKYLTVGLLVLWIGTLITGGALATRYGPEIAERAESHPFYATVSKNYDVSEFSAVEVHGTNRINIVRGNFSATASGQQRDLEALDIHVEDGTLIVSRKPQNRVCLFCDYKAVTVEVSMPEFRSAKATGASRVTSRDFSGSELSVELSGASRGTLAVTTGKLSATASGAARFEVSGTASSTDIKLSGSSRFEGEEFRTNAATINMSGASRAHIYAEGSIHVTASGASRLYYGGDPIIRETLSGSSRIDRINSSPSDFNQPTAPEPSME